MTLIWQVVLSIHLGEGKVFGEGAIFWAVNKILKWYEKGTIFAVNKLKQPMISIKRNELIQQSSTVW